MKIQSFKYFNKRETANIYTKMYAKNKDNSQYPINYLRFKIINKILKKSKPKQIIDAGCGAGLPLIMLKKKGFNIVGYDKSAEMIKKAKENLNQNNFSKDLISYGDFENPKHLKDNSTECILGMGTFYYSKNFFKTINAQKKKLKKNGRLIFSLRNKLFNVSTFNNYTSEFYKEFFKINSFDNKIKREFIKITKKFKNKNKLKKNIDTKNVFSHVHNPLTIKNEILEKTGLIMENLYFYHYHALPPQFEKNNSKIFNKKSLEMEIPDSWKGYLAASAFVVSCVKK